MSSWWRRVRGVLGLGALWGAAAGAVGVVGGAIAGLMGGGPIFVMSLSGAVMGTLGLMLGTAFGSVLTLSHGSRTLDELTPRRTAGLGFVAGAGLSFVGNSLLILLAGAGAPAGMIVPALFVSSTIYGVLTAGLAYGTVAIAKRAPDDRLIEAGRGAELTAGDHG
ncbi:MAG: hypothetical protein AAF389_02835 [Gemmatimonadota bacterium]